MQYISVNGQIIYRKGRKYVTIFEKKDGNYKVFENWFFTHETLSESNVNKVKGNTNE